MCSYDSDEGHYVLKYIKRLLTVMQAEYVFRGGKTLFYIIWVSGMRMVLWLGTQNLIED